MFKKISYFLRYFLHKFQEQKCLEHVSLFNDLPEVKKKYHQGTISLGH